MNGAQAFRFQSFFQGGFECSTHVRKDGRRLDLVGSTGHDKFTESDYRLLQSFGMSTVREGIRWHLIEQQPGRYKFASAMPMIEAARITGTEVIWDLCHYGWPEDIDVFAPAFVDRFAALAGAFARLLRDEGHKEPLLAPLNEPSFVAWAGGDAAYLNPFQTGRGFELKCQLIRAVIAAVDEIADVLPAAKIVHCEPAIHITADPSRPQDRETAERFRLYQFESLDMLSGRVHPEIGGSPKYLGILGLNYYSNNQWIHNGRTLYQGDPLYRPLRELLREFSERYQRPIFVAETGNEDERRASWLAYVAAEVEAAITSGIPVHGICLYPVLNHPGWDDDRHCCCGLFDYADESGHRAVDAPLAAELRGWQARFKHLALDGAAAAGAH